MNFRYGWNVDIYNTLLYIYWYQCHQAETLYQKLNYASQLYEQGKFHTMECLEGYLNNWLRWAKGIGVSITAALRYLSDTLQSLQSQIMI